ncbi:hypothetical protein ACFV9W_15895 [Streptomyces sp. NPDC059897]|uniref:hypothetical protein n=1 Tax=Streptomyces sp. NPDC059897 TaxID=3346994 RepID=UPI0036515504
MQKYYFIAENLTATRASATYGNACGTVYASSPEAARKTVERSLRSQGYEPTGGIKIF